MNAREIGAGLYHHHLADNGREIVGEVTRGRVNKERMLLVLDISLLHCRAGFSEEVTNSMMTRARRNF